MKFLDGFKTILGTVVLVVGTAIPKIAPAVAAGAEHAIGIVQGVGGLLAVLGLIHKGEKRAARAGGGS